VEMGVVGRFLKKVEEGRKGGGVSTPRKAGEKEKKRRDCIIKKWLEKNKGRRCRQNCEREER